MTHSENHSIRNTSLLWHRSAIVIILKELKEDMILMNGDTASVKTRKAWQKPNEKFRH